MGDFSARVIDHFSNPRNNRPLDHPDVSAEVANPCCGDRLRLEARVVGGTVVACSFLAYGCAASVAVGSLLTEALPGRGVDELARLDAAGIAALAGGLSPRHRHTAELGADALRALAKNYRDAHPNGAQP